ncbi:hypothetical protein MY3296_005950 [Beauveria thailandica]
MTPSQVRDPTTQFPHLLPSLPVITFRITLKNNQLSQQRQRRLAAKEISRRVAPVTHPAVKVQADLHAHKVKPVVNCDADNPVAGLEDIAPYLAAVGAIKRLVRGRGLCGA